MMQDTQLNIQIKEKHAKVERRQKAHNSTKHFIENLILSNTHPLPLKNRVDIMCLGIKADSGPLLELVGFFSVSN